MEFDINEHFTELMKSVGLDPSDTGGTITFVGEDPIMESRIRLGAAYSIPYMGTAAAAAMIWKMRTGRGQDLKIDLRKAIHYIADIPWSTLNGRNYPASLHRWAAHLMEENYPTKDGRRFSPIGFYPDMERAWCEFLGCPANERGYRREDRRVECARARDSMQCAWACGRDGAHHRGVGQHRMRPAIGANAGDRDHEDRRQ